METKRNFLVRMSFRVVLSHASEAEVLAVAALRLREDFEKIIGLSLAVIQELPTNQVKALAEAPFADQVTVQPIAAEPFPEDLPF